MFRRIWQSAALLLLLLGPACVPWPRPARPPLPVMLARAEPLLAERRYGEAVTILEEAARLYPAESGPLVHIGQVYLAQHRWLLAEDAFNRALARDPDRAQAAAGLAEALLNQGRLAEALRWWQEAAQRNPHWRGVYTGQGRTYLQLLEFEAAQAAFRQQQAVQPEPEAQWYLAALTAPLDPAAAASLLRAIPEPVPAGLAAWRDYLLAALEPSGTPATSPVEAAKKVGIALAQAGLAPLAIHALTLARNATPADGETLAFLGHALAQAGRPALELLDQARQAAPASALPAYFQGLYLRRQGALRAAQDQFKQALQLEPDNPAIYAELAATLAQGGNLSDAEAVYLAAGQVAKNDPAFQLMLARFYSDYGYHLAEAGIPLAATIVKAQPDSAEGYTLLGSMQYRAGQPGAVESLRRALELNPDLVEARYYLARALEQQGALIEAIAEYRRVIDWDTSNVFRDKALKDLQRLNA